MVEGMAVNVRSVLESRILGEIGDDRDRQLVGSSGGGVDDKDMLADSE